MIFAIILLEFYSDIMLNKTIASRKNLNLNSDLFQFFLITVYSSLSRVWVFEISNYLDGTERVRSRCVIGSYVKPWLFSSSTDAREDLHLSSLTIYN